MTLGKRRSRIYDNHTVLYNHNTIGSHSKTSASIVSYQAKTCGSIHDTTIPIDKDYTQRQQSPNQQIFYSGCCDLITKKSIFHMHMKTFSRTGTRYTLTFTKEI